MTDPAPVPGTAGRDLLDTARGLGHAVWAERRLFEVLGGWVPTMADPEAKVLVSAQSHHHAWRASVLVDRLPELRQVPLAQVVVPAAGWAEVMSALAGPEDQVDRLAGLYRVVGPHLVSTYGAWLDAAVPVADAPLARWLRIIRDDAERDGADGERVLGRLEGAGTDGAGAHVEELVRLLGAAAPI